MDLGGVRCSIPEGSSAGWKFKTSMCTLTILKCSRVKLCDSARTSAIPVDVRVLSAWEER